MSDATVEPDVETELNRDIGLVGAIAIGVGTMIAAGIFVLSGLAVSNVGAMAIVSFLIAAVVASFTAFAYAEFSAIYPESGGGYAYVANVFDTDLTYIVGWSMILGYPASAAFYLASFSDWFYRFILPLMGTASFDAQAAVPYWISGILVLGLLLAVNLKGIEETGLFQIVLTAVKVALIVLFLYGGLRAFDAGTIAQSFTANVTEFRQIGLTSALVFITFFGFEAIATNAEEIEQPGRNVPRAIFISMGFVTIVYTLVVLVVVLAINDLAFLEFLRAEASLAGLTPEAFIAANGEIAMGRAAQYYLEPVGFYVVIVGALFSMLSAANATIMAGSRVKLAMARRDHLPKGFEDLHPSFETPYRSVLLTGSFILIIIAYFTVIFGGGPGAEAGLHVGAFEIHLGIEAIAHFADFMLLFGLIVVNFAVIRSRQINPDLDRPFEVPAVPWIPVIAVLANLVLLLNIEPSSFALGLVAEIIGIGLWFGLIGRTDTERIEQETPTILEERSPEGREFRIVVPVANPDHVQQLMRTADDIARANDGEVIVMSVVTLSEQTPLSRGRQYVDEQREVIDRAMAIADGQDVPVSGVIRIGHHTADAIVNTIDQHDADAVLLGRSGTGSRRRDIVLGNTVDAVVREATCDVFVEKIHGGAGGGVESILLPTAGGPHAELSADVAAAIARTESSNVTVLHVIPSEASQSRRQLAETTVERAAEAFEGLSVTTRIVEDDDVAEAIVAITDEHDLTVIGATQEGLLQELVFGAVPETVGERAKNTVIMTKRYIGITSRVKRWLRWG